MLNAGKWEVGGGRRNGPPLSAIDLEGMAAAVEEARLAAAEDEVPIGAVVTCDGRVVARAHNQTIVRRDPTAHAELLVMQLALAALKSDRLPECTLYVTLEPCAQCAGAIVLAKVGRLVFGAFDPKAGMCGSQGDLVRHPRLNHRVEVLGGVDAETCGPLLEGFFKTKR